MNIYENGFALFFKALRIIGLRAIDIFRKNVTFPQNMNYSTVVSKVVAIFFYIEVNVNLSKS
jgi:hypothetical protein